MRKPCAFFGCLFLLWGQAFSCEYNIRDAGFVDLSPQCFHLYFFIDDQTSPEHITHFQKATRIMLYDSNVEAEVVDITRHQDHRAMDYYRFWDVQKSPALILVSPDLRSLALPLAGKGDILNESIRQEVANTVLSALREEILSHVVASYALIVLIESPDQAANQAALAKINEAAGKIALLMRQLPKRIDEAPQVLRLSPERSAREKVMLWSLDLQAGDQAKPQIAVLFGRGRVLFRPLESQAVTASDLFNMLSVLGLSCDCGLDKRGMMEMFIPLRWDENMQAQVVRHLGFDAENPLIRREITGILSLDRFSADTGAAADSSSRIFSQYREGAVAFERKFGSERISPALTQELHASGSPAAGSGFDLVFPLLLGGALILIISAAALYLRHRAQQKGT